MRYKLAKLSIYENFLQLYMTHGKEYESFKQSYKNENSVQCNKNGVNEFETLPSKNFASIDNDNKTNLIMRKNNNLPININENWGCLLEAKNVLSSTGIEQYLADLAEVVFELGIVEKAEHLAQQCLFFHQVIQKIEEKDGNLKVILNANKIEENLQIRTKETKKTETPYDREERRNIDSNDRRYSKVESRLNNKNFIKPFDGRKRKNSRSDSIFKNLLGNKNETSKKYEMLSIDRKLDLPTIKKKRLEINVTDLFGRICLIKNQDIKALEMFEKCYEISTQINDDILTQKYNKIFFELKKKIQFLNQLKEVREDRDMFTEYTNENFRTKETLADENLKDGVKLDLKQKYKTFRKRKSYIFSILIKNIL